MWSTAHRAEFDDRGFARLEGTFDRMTAGRMREVAWRELEQRYGVRPPGLDTPWPAFVSGMKSTKRHRVFDALGTPALASALDDLLGHGRWEWPKQWGNVLVTPPGAGAWTLPHRLWHIDYPYTLPVAPLVACKVFVFFGDVEPGGGGTLLLERSHRLTEQHVAELTVDDRKEYRRVRDAFLRHDPWLRALTNRLALDDPDRVRHFLDDGAVVDGVPTKVVELTGRPGDVIVTHPWIYHCAAPNVNAVPRFMRGTGFLRRSRVAERGSDEREAAVDGEDLAGDVARGR